MGLFRKKPNTVATVNAEQKALHKNLGFAASEQYRLLRTNIMFTIPEGVKCPVIGVTSSVRGEGKSTTAVNLSYVLAEKDSRVLLIDGDLRRPSVARKMGIESVPGLSNLLLGAGAEIASWQSPEHKNWYILPSGDIPPNPSELLGSRRMENVLNSLKESFDYIIIDLPPVNIVSDAMSIARLITGMLVVVREDYATRKELEQCIRQIRLSNVNVLGFVMNGAHPDGAPYPHYKQNHYDKAEAYEAPAKKKP